MLANFFTKMWYGKTLSCRTSLKSGTAAAVPAVPAAPPMETIGARILTKIRRLVYVFPHCKTKTVQ